MIEPQPRPRPANGSPEASASQTGRYHDFVEAGPRDHREALALAEQAAGIGIWDIDIPAQTLRGTDQFFHLLGLPPTDRPTPVEAVQALRLADDREQVARAYSETITSGRDTFESEYRIRRPDGAIRWIYERGRIFRNAAGKPCRHSGINIDITERKAADDAQQGHEAYLQLALDAAGLGVWQISADGRITGSPELNRIFGFPPDHTLTRDDLAARFLPGEGERLREARQKAFAAGERFVQVEFRIKWPDESVHWILLRAELQFEPGSKTPAGALGVVVDITDRKEAEERQQLLMRELDHRVKNTLATVQAISHQTFRMVEDVPAAVATFDARLAALANAHSVLTNASWRAADLKEIVASVLQPFQDPERERFHVSGPSIYLSPQVALAMAMTLHELATNAAKYGALSSPRGAVDLTWQRLPSAHRVRIVWSEHDGPPVKQPTKTGFGSRLIHTGIASAGTVKLDFAPAGLVCTFEIAL